MTKSLQFARPMMRRGAGFDTNEARRQLLKEWQNVPALELAANDYITCRVNSVDLKNRLGDIETDCRDRLHGWLLRIVGALTAPTSMALPCRWRSRPQHQNRTDSQKPLSGAWANVQGQATAQLQLSNQSPAMCQVGIPVTRASLQVRAIRAGGSADDGAPRRHPPRIGEGSPRSPGVDVRRRRGRRRRARRPRTGPGTS